MQPGVIEVLMHILVTGATGYIGGRLVPRLLEAGHTVRCFARDPGRLSGRFQGVEVIGGDLFEPSSVLRALEGVDAAFYLVHSMSGSRRDFARNDREAAALFGDVAREAGVARIVYLGGLGDARKSLSPHLSSRQEVGDVLRASGVPVTEFRAAMIVGSGSASFEMMRYLTDRLPLMIAPKWVRTRCQPIAVSDVLAYLTQEVAAPRTGDALFEIGGADVLTYEETMLHYARIRGLRRAIVVVPFFTPRLSSAWVHLVTPIPSSIARPLIDGLHNEVVVRDAAALTAFPAIRPLGYDTAVHRALNRYASTGPETTWFDAYDVRTLPGEFAGTTQGMLVDRRQASANAPASALFHVFTSLGGRRGWLYADALWEFRGVLDRLAGGVGMRRGRRSASELRIGDALDFWRVEAYEPDRLLRLRAEMRLPGAAWLQFESLPERNGTSTLRQTAFFEPRGILGYLYWFIALPFHTLIFGTMCRRVAQRAEESVAPNAHPAAA